MICRLSFCKRCECFWTYKIAGLVNPKDEPKRVEDASRREEDADFVDEEDVKPLRLGEGQPSPHDEDALQEVDDAPNL